MDGRYAENAGAFFGWHEDGRDAENAGAFFGWHEDGGLSRPSMASEALGLLPGGMPKMQEHFSAGTRMAGMPKMQEHFSARHGWRPLSAIHGLRGPLTVVPDLRGTWAPAQRTWAPARRDAENAGAFFGGRLDGPM